MRCWEVTRRVHLLRRGALVLHIRYGVSHLKIWAGQCYIVAGAWRRLPKRADSLRAIAGYVAERALRI